MKNLENILKNLPKKQLAKKADALIRFRLIKLMINTRFLAWKSSPLFMPAFRLTLIAFAILIIFFPAFSYTNQNIVKGDVLYPVKRAMEKLEYLTAIDQVSKAEKSVKFSERRLDEAKKIEENNKILETKKQEKIDTVKDAIKDIESADNIIINSPENNKQTVKIKEKIIELKKNNYVIGHKFKKDDIQNVFAPSDEANTTIMQNESDKKDSIQELKIENDRSNKDGNNNYIENNGNMRNIASSTDTYKMENYNKKNSSNKEQIKKKIERNKNNDKMIGNESRYNKSTSTIDIEKNSDDKKSD